MHVAELLVSHGASLNAKTFLEETPIGIFTPQHSLINTPEGGGVKKTNVFSQQGLISSLFSRCKLYISGSICLNAALNLFKANLNLFCVIFITSCVSFYIFSSLDGW